MFGESKVKQNPFQKPIRNLSETTPPRRRIHAEAFAATDACQAIRSISSRKATEAQQRYTEWQPLDQKTPSDY